jgi:hypothetical protein
MFKHYGDSIYLDGMEIPLSTFMRLEPSYQYPSDLIVMFYDGKMRNFRTKHRSWTLNGAWAEGDRYLSRIGEFSRLLAMEKVENVAVAEAVAKAKSDAESAALAKYPLKGEKPNVELHERTDLNKGGTEGVRSKGKRSSRSRDKHSG